MATGRRSLRVHTQWETFQFVSYFTRHSEVINSPIGRGRKVWRRRYVTPVVNQNGRGGVMRLQLHDIDPVLDRFHYGSTGSSNNSINVETYEAPEQFILK